MDMSKNNFSAENIDCDLTCLGIKIILLAFKLCL